jgi:hypothetical protein
MKIFLGFTEVANFINTYKKGFEQNGHSTFTVISRHNKYYPNAIYDIVLCERVKTFHKLPSFLNRIIKSFLTRFYSYQAFLIALRTCEIFIYNTGGNILPFCLDYKLIKLFKRKLVVIFLGSEIRHWYVYKLELEKLGYAKLFESGIEAYRVQNYGNYKEKLARVHSAEKYADLILSHPSFAQLQTKPYMRGYIGLEIDKYKYNTPLNDIPIIVHAPTNRGVKGTDYVEMIVNSLISEGYKIDFRLIENMPNDKLLELLAESDIVIDELNSDSIGVLSTESMATGNVVLTSYFVEHFGNEANCPILNTNKDNLRTNLKKVIVDKSLREKLAIEGRRYVEKYNNLNLITNNIISLLETPKNKISFDVVPEKRLKYDIPKEIERL